MIIDVLIAVCVFVLAAIAFAYATIVDIEESRAHVSDIIQAPELPNEKHKTKDKKIHPAILEHPDMFEWNDEGVLVLKKGWDIAH